jgi:hypothetical protein
MGAIDASGGDYSLSRIISTEAQANSSAKLVSLLVDLEPVAVPNSLKAR